VVNSLSARADGKQWTAKRVARRLAEMKYVYEYCRAFQDEVDETARKVEALTDGDYAWRKDRAERDACESITGYSSFGSFVRGLAEDWTDFPDRWPWNE
jgi:phage host-nuclease inhibitor protein Gam